MNLPKLKLKKSFIINIQAIVGEDNYSTQNIDRLSYSRDSNFRAAIQAHYSQFENFPAIIVWPENVEQVALLIKTARKFKVAVTPFGGGSGVCGGAISYNGAMIIDSKRMKKLIRLDPDRLFIDAQTGIQGLLLQESLERRGFTLGHFPSSILSACLGGYLAARSAGQQSSKYGKIEDMVIDLEFVDGLGRLHKTSDVSRRRGLDLTQMIVGSEGTLGFITKARLKIFLKPQNQNFQAYTFKTINYGMEALRRIMQTGIKPDVLRLYDELDSALVFADLSKSDEGTFHIVDAMPAFLKNSIKVVRKSAMGMVFRSHRLINELARYSWTGCILIIMLEGQKKIIEQQHKIIATICQDINAKDIGEEAAINWKKHRYSVSYKASKLFLDGAFTDTLEVATTWDNLSRLYHGVIKRLKPHCLVLAHISHVYNEGAAIYFTVVAPLKGPKRSLQAYDKLWKTALDAVQYYGGVLSHHHGIGRLKKDHIKKEWGEAKFLYDKLKSYFDPDGIMNPGVLH